MEQFTVNTDKKRGEKYIHVSAICWMGGNRKNKLVTNEINWGDQ